MSRNTAKNTSRKGRNPRRRNVTSRVQPSTGYSVKDNAYCVKCRKMKNMLNVRQVKSKNGRNMLKGTCSECGTKMNKFI